VINRSSSTNVQYCFEIFNHHYILRRRIRFFVYTGSPVVAKGNELPSNMKPREVNLNTQKFWQNWVLHVFRQPNKISHSCEKYSEFISRRFEDASKLPKSIEHKDVKSLLPNYTQSNEKCRTWTSAHSKHYYRYISHKQFMTNYLRQS
jgi:hypothetical protein